jgi:putative DeoR family transcriptional regulator (stage III sporulation protein D)
LIAIIHSSSFVLHHSFLYYSRSLPHIFELKLQQSEGNHVKILVETRALELGEYIASSGATVRSAAKKFGISKSTVHKDVSERLKYIDPALHSQVKGVLDTNKAQRHIRGGLATRQKYDAVRKCRNQTIVSCAGEVTA